MQSGRGSRRRAMGAIAAMVLGTTIALVGAENIAEAMHRPGAVALGAGGLLLIMGLGKLAGLGGLPPLLLLPAPFKWAATAAAAAAARSRSL